ncbi:MAG: hypothetical protein M1819_004217 [Sarea resinae]|nr:MAG: hypothetical protein M1819_004217 [Sarea resinae]
MQRDDVIVDALHQHPMKHVEASRQLSDPSLVSTLSAHGMFPTHDEVERRREAFHLLKTALQGSSSNSDASTFDIPMVTIPVGSYALGVWTSASVVDCLCIGSISSKTFRMLARQRIRRAEGQGIHLLRTGKIEASTGTMLELLVKGVHMVVQYCSAAKVIERWSEFHDLPANDPVFNLPLLSLRRLKPYRDIAYILRTLPSLSAFRLAYRCIKLWAIQRGVYSSKFGYMDSTQITFMLSWVCRRLAYDIGSVTAADLVTTFFYYYAKFDWANAMVFDAFFHQGKPRYNRTARDPMVILGFSPPNASVARTTTAAGLQTVVREFKLAIDRLSVPDISWGDFFGSFENSTPNPGVSRFLNSYKSYAKLDTKYWGRSPSNGKRLVNWVESQCSLLVAGNLAIRIWPARFADRDTDNTSEADYHGCYLIGLSKTEDAHSDAKREDKIFAQQTLDKCLDRFLSKMQGDRKHYDETSSWVGISLVKPDEVQYLVLDNREWGDFPTDLEEEGSDDDEDDHSPTLELQSSPHKLPIRPATLVRSSTPVARSKLRPASDVLNRLRWDPNLDPSTYIVGYEDRFVGAREMTLERWKTEQTDEEFIPQHRILYFKKKGEGGAGEVVWERKTRIDRVFGSGVSQGTVA